MHITKVVFTSNIDHLFFFLKLNVVYYSIEIPKYDPKLLFTWL